VSSDPTELGRGIFGYRKSAVNQIIADRDIMLRQAEGRVRAAEGKVAELEAEMAALRDRNDRIDEQLARLRGHVNSLTAGGPVPEAPSTHASPIESTSVDPDADPWSDLTDEDPLERLPEQSAWATDEGPEVSEIGEIQFRPMIVSAPAAPVVDEAEDDGTDEFGPSAELSHLSYEEGLDHMAAHDPFEPDEDAGLSQLRWLSEPADVATPGDEDDEDPIATSAWTEDAVAPWDRHAWSDDDEDGPDAVTELSVDDAEPMPDWTAEPAHQPSDESVEEPAAEISWTAPAVEEAPAPVEVSLDPQPEPVVAAAPAVADEAPARSKETTDITNRFLTEEIAGILAAAEESAARIVERARTTTQHQIAQSNRLWREVQGELSRFAAWREMVEPVMRAIHDKVEGVRDEIDQVPERIRQALAPMADSISTVDGDLSELLGQWTPPLLLAPTGLGGDGEEMVVDGDDEGQSDQGTGHLHVG
jgi:hypothetical protein